LRERKAPAKEVISAFHFHHIIFHAFEGEDKWWNLHPIIIVDHQARTRKDIGTIAKVKRVEKKWRAFTANMASPRKKKRKSKHRWGGKPVNIFRAATGPKRKFRWPKRKMQSRGFRK